MKIIINGVECDVNEQVLWDVVVSRKFNPEKVVIELNGDIIARQNWSSQNLKHGDKLEIVGFVAGG